MDTIYFCDADDRIKIGFSSTPESRIKAHESYGLRLRAVLFGGYANEQELHKYFSNYKLDFGKENFEPSEEIYNYIDALLSNNFAVQRLEEMNQLSSLPYSVWRPENISYAAHNDGQLDLVGHLPAKDRVKYLSDMAYNSSASDEWYTPKYIIDLTREVFGEIDLDPATTGFVNSKWIRAPNFYTKETNGLSPNVEWFGRVWLNPPYGRGDNSAAAFIERLCTEFASGNVSEAITCLNVNSTTSNWFQNVWGCASSHCIQHGRLAYISPNGETGKSPPKGTIFSYFGPNKNKFEGVFRKAGTIIRTAE